MVAIARAAGVSVSWLATGVAEGIPDDGALPQDPWQEIEFQERFDSLLSKHGGIDGLAQLSGIPAHRLNRVKAGGELNRSEWRALSKSTKACIGWLMGAEDDASKDIRPPISELTEFSKLLHSDEMKEEVRGLLRNHPAPSTWKSAPVSRASVGLEILQRLPSSGLIPFTMKDDSMHPTIHKGDLLIFTAVKAPKEPDLYLIEDKERESFIVCRLAVNGGKTFGIRDNPQFGGFGPFEYKDSIFRCHGRLFSRVVNV
jgi:hypothetical protein